jgi:hypothetical protein
MEISTKDSIRTTNAMVEVSTLGPTAMNMRVKIWTVRSMVRANSSMLMAIDIMENTSMTKRTVMGSLCGQMVINILESIKMTRGMVKEYYSIRLGRSIKGYGKITNS